MNRPPNRLVFAGEALVDLLMWVPALPERGGDMLAESSSVQVGGGFNIMAAAARQGLPVVYAGGHGTGPWGEGGPGVILATATGTSPMAGALQSAVPSLRPVVDAWGSRPSEPLAPSLPALLVPTGSSADQVLPAFAGPSPRSLFSGVDGILGEDAPAAGEEGGGGEQPESSGLDLAQGARQRPEGTSRPQTEKWDHQRSRQRAWDACFADGCWALSRGEDGRPSPGDLAGDVDQQPADRAMLAAVAVAHLATSRGEERARGQRPGRRPPGR